MQIDNSTGAVLQLEATHLRDRRWAVRPKGQLGTCGFHPKPWTAVYVNARNESEALRKAGGRCFS